MTGVGTDDGCGHEADAIPARSRGHPAVDEAAVCDSELAAAAEIQARVGLSQIRHLTSSARIDPSGCGATACCEAVMLDGGVSRQAGSQDERRSGRMASYCFICYCLIFYI
ncbi:unnamed protein product [Urochloa humidicola]